MQIIINYCSAFCGSGKTYSLIEKACQLAQWGNRVLVLQPTIELIEKTIEQQLPKMKFRPEYAVFHGERISGSVSHAVMEHAKKGAKLNGTIVFSTHQILSRIGSLPEKHKWFVLIDEELQVHQCNQYKVPHTHHLITNHIDADLPDGTYSQLMIRDEEAIKNIARNKDKDVVLEKFRSLAQLLENDHWASFVNYELYRGLLNGERKTLTVHSVLDPSVLEGFWSVTMASALFEDSMVYQLWKDTVEFVRDDSLKLRFSEHENSGLVTIKYANEASWSRRRRKTQLREEGQATILDEIILAAKREFEGKEFLYHTNLDVKDKTFGGGATRIPSVPHGLNDYSGIHNIVFVSSLNPPPEHFRFMSERHGIDGDHLKKAIYCATAYQAVMRTSIRDPNNKDPKVVIVPDKALAEYLLGVFPGSKPDKLNTDIPEASQRRGRPQQFASNNERVAHHRRNKTRKDLIDGIMTLDGIALPGPDANKGMVNVNEYFCNERGIDVITSHITQITHATVYRDKTQTTDPAYLNYDDIGELVELLRDAHEKEKASKDRGNLLFSPAIFNSEGRKINNIEFMRHIWLDFEDGELRPEQLQAILPGTRVIVMTTFRHEAASPRFRVVIPTSRPITVEAYRYLWDEVARKVEKEGYWVEGRPRQAGSISSGLDRSSRKPTQLYYAPCRRVGSTDALFLDHPGEIVDPIAWIESSETLPEVVAVPHGFMNAPSPVFHGTSDQAREAAILRWHDTRPGRGDHEFFRLGLNLRRAGMSMEEIEATLNREVQFAHSPEERERQIAGIISTLSEPRRAA